MKQAFAALPAVPALTADAGDIALPTPFTLSAALGLVVLALAVWLIVRARKPALPPLQLNPGLVERLRLKTRTAPFTRWTDLVDRVLKSLRYLSTRREWRYQVPWVMLVGEKGAGKSSLAASIASGRRQNLLLREQRLAVAGTSWRFFDHGVLVDPAGALPAASFGSDEHKDWQGILAALDGHRPERPLDALILAVSAPTLLNADAEAREALAEQCYEQLFILQKRFEFAYPIYVVLTQCDAVSGFDAFWQAMPPERLKEIWGWSNPSFEDGGTAQQCVAAAWKSLGNGLRQLQVEAAATGAAIADGDRFFLFPQRFTQIEAPLARFLDTVLRPSAYHASYYLRGIYCAGSMNAAGALRDDPRQDVCFVDSLFDRKVFAETWLARPTRQSVWSRNRLLRRVQIGGIGFLALLFLALAATASHLGDQVTTLKGALETLSEPAAETQTCIDKDTVYGLLAQIGQIDTNLKYPAIPMSWVRSSVMETSVKVISEDAFKKVIMPGFACRIEQKSRELLAGAPEAPADEVSSAEAVERAANRLNNHLAELVRFEEQRRAFDMLAARSSVEDTDTQAELMWKLAAYVYGDAPLQMAHRDNHAFMQAVAQIEYPKPLQLPPEMKASLTKQIDTLAAALADQLAHQAGMGEEMIGRMERGEAGVLGGARRFGWWLDWVRKEWLASNEKFNPCRRVAEAVDRDIARLRDDFVFPAAITEVTKRFSTASCYEPAMRKLAGTHLPRYGNMFAKAGSVMEIAAPVAAELRGMVALTAEDFMQVPATQPFACLAGGIGWRPQSIEEAGRYIRDYQMFARLQGADADAAAGGTRPLYDGLARRHLQRLLDQTLSHGQLAAPAPRAMQGAVVEALSTADQELSRRSSDFAKVVDPLLQMMHLYRQLGFDANADSIAQCVRNFSADTLLKVEALAEASQLFEPPAEGVSESETAPVYAVGNGAIAKDYFARQLQRAQVLGNYAAPFVAFLKNSEAVDESRRANQQSAAYWDNTLSELRRYVQFKEPNGQVAFLENYVVKQLADLTYDNCRKTLAAYRSDATANDFFAARRRNLEQQTKARCDNRGEADAYAQYREIATRFNGELAGRYPFADLDAHDAPADAVRAFFTDYDGRRAGLKAALADLAATRWQGVRSFVDELDAAAAFFRAGLTAADGPQPMRLDIGFRALPKQSPGSEQIVYWRLLSGSRTALYPNGGSSIEWPVGEVLALELQWAEQSAFRPVGDPGQADLVVEGRSASFIALGEWALLRLIDGHRPRAVPAGTGTDGGRKAMAEFAVPVSTQKIGPAPGRTDTARAYLALSVSGVNAKTQASTAVKVPAFPKRAPVLW